MYKLYMLLMMIAAFAFASCGSHNHDDHKEGEEHAEEVALCNTGRIVAMMMRMSFVGAMVVVAIFYSGAYLPIVMMVRYCWQQ
jgi:hypothetical protein